MRFQFTVNIYSHDLTLIGQNTLFVATCFTRLVIKRILLITN